MEQQLRAACSGFDGGSSGRQSKCLLGVFIAIIGDSRLDSLTVAGMGKKKDRRRKGRESGVAVAGRSGRDEVPSFDMKREGSLPRPEYFGGSVLCHSLAWGNDKVGR